MLFGCNWISIASLMRLHGTPLKMDPTEGSETSANINQKLEIHPKVETVNNEQSDKNNAQ
jgi:hypothetical protein